MTTTTVQQPDSFLIRSGNFFFKYRDQVFPIFFGSLIVIYPFIWGLQDTFLSARWDLTALGMAFVGEWFRVATVGMEYIIRGGLNKQVHADKLVTEGMFRHCRNPLYVGNLLLVGALLLLSGNCWVLATGSVFIIYVYISIVAAEERFLRNKFGRDYDAYCERVNRWIPNFSGFAETLASTRFNWRRVFVKEYSSFFFWCVSALGVVTYKLLWHYPVAQVSTLLTVFAGLLVTLVAVFILFVFSRKRLA